MHLPGTDTTPNPELWRKTMGASNLPATIGSKLDKLVEEEIDSMSGSSQLTTCQNHSQSSTGHSAYRELDVPQTFQPQPPASAKPQPNPEQSMLSNLNRSPNGTGSSEATGRITNSRLVFLTVNVNEEYQLAQIKSNGIHDDNFF